MEQAANWRTGTGAFLTVTALFFAWGFISSNTDPLIVALRAIFSLNYREGLSTQLVFFFAYGVVSLPAAAVANHLGPLRTIFLALTVMIVGCLLVWPAATVGAFPAILAALFVLGAGVTTLQVAANPLMAALGPSETSHFRLTFAQAFNSLGVVMGVHFGARLMLGDGTVAALYEQAADPATRLSALGLVIKAFFLIAGLVAFVLALVWFARVRIRAAMGPIAVNRASVFEALRAPWARFGALAIGLYVGAEVSIGSIMINFLHDEAVLGLPFAEGGRWLANFYWGGALLGRFIGAFLLARLAAARLLAFAALIAAGLCLTVVAGDGAVAAIAALAVGLFNSIMFPTIFSLTLERTRGVSEASTSGLLCLAIVGGAILPFLVGLIADAAGLSWSFVVPMTAYLVIGRFAARAAKQTVK